ncbi:MAG: acyloxyacyl hydrolase [Verrucomicrobiota bacterium]|nr:acyloxyacyl hydrolase [Verrucomicrobiota bacterium]
MSIRRILALFVFAAVFASTAHAGSEAVSSRLRSNGELDAPSFEFAAESTYMLGVFGNPHNYEIAAAMLTARMRWGAIHSDGFMRGYNQVYFQFLGEAFTRGLENHYWGVNAGFRYNFIQPGCRLQPYVSGGIGLGWVDATNTYTAGALGQNFTFNIQSTVGVDYKLNDHWKANLGIIYQHLSNAGLSEPERPNSSLNTLGPQIGATYSF